MKKTERDFACGIFTAAAVFTALTLFSAALSNIPGSGFGRGLAVMSARLSFLYPEKEPQDSGKDTQNAESASPGGTDNDAPSSTVISPHLSRQLIALTGFGAWDIEAAPEEKQDEDTEPQEEYPEASGNELPYPDDINSRDGLIVRKTYSYFASDTFLELPNGAYLRNCTDIDGEYLLDQASRPPDFDPNTTGEPFVLIMHTHTTESYEPEIRGYYDSDFTSRTTDPEKSVVAVGNKIAAELETAGIGVIHDTTVHDYPRYTGAYDRSAKTVADWLQDYPSIKIVIDVHRDALEEDGVRYAPVVDIGGKSAAQVMIISGCKNVPQYRYNLRIATRLQSKMELNCPGLTRPILFDDRNYNQEMTHGSFLIEIGSNANALEEALLSGELVGKALAQVISEGW